MDRRILYVLGAAALLSSCAKVEMTDGGKALDPNQIAFSVRSGLQTQPGTRSGPEEEQPAMLLGGQGEDTLYLHPSVVVNDRGFGMPATRDVPIRDDRGITSFFVTAKVNDAGNPAAADALYFDETEVKRAGNGVWTTTDGKHFWPDGQTTLDFYAYSNLIFAENDSPGVSSLTCEDGRLGFSYIVPNGPEGSDAVQQPDILFALASANRSQTQDGDGTVILNFQHALAGVQFRAKNIAGGTIQSITLKNLYGQGDCTYTLSGETTDSGARKNGTFEWSNLGTKTDFTQKMSVKVSDSGILEDSVQDITTNGKNSEMTFMMIPQSTADVEVEIVLEGDNNELYKVSGKLGNTGEWRPGNIYIYDISTDSINWTYVFKVTDNIKFELGQTSKPYTVTSYRYRTQLGDLEANREPVPWTASCVSANETDSKTDSRGPVEPASVVTEFQDKGDGDVSESGEECGLVLKRGTLHTTYDGDEKLQNAAPKGSEDSPYDLSVHDWQDNNISATTANCYIVNAPGTYMLPLVYGNAIKNGTRNTSAYNNPNFKDYQNQEIKSPYIYDAYTPYDACLVWSDGFYMFENVHLSNDKKYLIFSINPDFLQQANAILAVRDAQGKIMWSWHIWVTERDIYKTVHQLQDYETGALNAYGMMQCNLGWVDGKIVYYNSRDLTFKFSQETSGNVQEMEVTQEGGKFDYKDVGSTYYQWGRKDPIVALRNWDTYRFEDSRLHETSDPKYKYNISQEQVPISTTIQNPNIYYTATNSNGTWNTNWCTSVIPTLWDNSKNTTDVNKTTSVKTIYDPSPRGYKVPIPRAFSVFVKGNTKSGATGQNAINGYQIESGDYNQYRVKPNRDGTGNEIPLTATGQRADRDDLEAYSSAEGKKSEPGGLWAMYGVYYWTSGQVSSNDNAGFSLCIRHDKGSNEYYYTYGFVGAKTMARPVRCIEDR